MKEKESIAVRTARIVLTGTLALTQSTPSREIDHLNSVTGGFDQNFTFVLCETDGGYFNPDNPEEFTPGVYNDKWEDCSEQESCYVEIPAVGYCVPPDFTPKKEEQK